MNSENLIYGNATPDSLGVSELNRYVKMLMESDALLSQVSVHGEISNLKYHTSGHIYFTLKDEESELSAVMFRSAAVSLGFRAENGMKVTVYGRISVYEKSGKYQLYASAMTNNGLGELQREFERLRAKLAAEGLFDAARKKPLPKFPHCIGIVTSPTGAAVRDMINITGRRWPTAKLLIYPSLVQGENAPADICRGIEFFNALGACDVMIVGRGGGSIEDLWAFNDERVVRAVAASEIPVISAVGHETDVTLCDHAADRRAPTPSAAAELAVPDKNEMKLRIDELFGRVDAAIGRYVTVRASSLDAIKKQILLSSPIERLKREQGELSHMTELISRSIAEIVRKKSSELEAISGRLSAISPLAVLGRGYGMVRDKDGKTVSSVRGLSKGDAVSISLSDGEADAVICAVRANGGGEDL